MTSATKREKLDIASWMISDAFYNMSLYESPASLYLSTDITCKNANSSCPMHLSTATNKLKLFTHLSCNTDCYEYHVHALASYSADRKTSRSLSVARHSDREGHLHSGVVCPLSRGRRDVRFSKHISHILGLSVTKHKYSKRDMLLSTQIVKWCWCCINKTVYMCNVCII